MGYEGTWCDGRLNEVGGDGRNEIRMVWALYHYTNGRGWEYVLGVHLRNV
jgi:hypothetical protein